MKKIKFITDPARPNYVEVFESDNLGNYPSNGYTLSRHFVVNCRRDSSIFSNLGEISIIDPERGTVCYEGLTFKFAELDGANCVPPILGLTPQAATVELSTNFFIGKYQVPSTGGAGATEATLVSVLNELVQANATLTNIYNKSDNVHAVEMYDAYTYLEVKVTEKPNGFIEIGIFGVVSQGGATIADVDWGDGVVDTLATHAYNQTSNNGGVFRVIVRLSDGNIISFIVSNELNSVDSSETRYEFSDTDGSTKIVHYLNWFKKDPADVIVFLGSTDKQGNPYTVFDQKVDTLIREKTEKNMQSSVRTNRHKSIYLPAGNNYVVPPYSINSYTIIGECKYTIGTGNTLNSDGAVISGQVEQGQLIQDEIVIDAISDVSILITY